MHDTTGHSTRSPNPMNKIFTIVGLTALPFLSGSCATTEANADSSTLTQGNVQMYLESGVTTKGDVIETFGSPNITTRDGEGHEMWVYERNSKEASSHHAFATVLLAGTSTSGFETSSKNVTLIIKFDDTDVVHDYDSRFSSF